MWLIIGLPVGEPMKLSVAGRIWLKDAFEILQVLVLKELALNAPTFFFQQIQPFFENISNAVRDPKVSKK